MNMKLFGILTFTVAGILQAQTLDLKGRVLQANGTPVVGATVLLKTKKDSTLTGADGSFSLGSSTSLGQAAGRAFEYRLEPDFLALDLRAKLDLKVEVVDGSGHLQGHLDRRLEEGQHRIALSEAMPVSGVNAGVYFLRLRLGGETRTHPFYHSGNGSTGSVFAPPTLKAAAKTAAGVDSLKIRKTGYQEVSKEITSYSAGNLGDITLPATTSDGWVNLFNGKDLTGWIPLFHLSKVGENTDSMFRPDLENNGIRVSYDKLTGSFGGDKCKCGNLYYNKPLTNYRFRMTYRFFDPTVPGAPSWGKNNSGLMIFGIDPAKVTGDPIYPPIVEIQILGTPSAGGSTNLNECEVGQFVNPTVTATHTGTCGNNKDSKAPGSGKTAPAAGVWTTIEADVHVNGDTKVYQWPDTTNAVVIISKPMYSGKAVTSGYLAIQSEGQPIVFKDIMLKELPQ
ncbi:MAG: family 16 glycoside hydrolase [Fibrobacteria bacterium]